MDVLVCVKHVPKEEDLRLDLKTKTLIRSEETGEISEKDRYALEMALRIKDATGGSITVLSMGIPAAKKTLRYSISVGADNAFLLSDRALGGSDAYATAKALKAAIEHLEALRGSRFSLILCGSRASDSDTALVTPSLAEQLGRPYLTDVTDFQLQKDGIALEKKTRKKTERWQLAFPSVISVGKLPYPLRYPKLGGIRHANKIEMPTLTLKEIALDACEVGAEGSLTSVGTSFYPERTKRAILLEDDENGSAVEKLADRLPVVGLM